MDEIREALEAWVRQLGRKGVESRIDGARLVILVVGGGNTNVSLPQDPLPEGASILIELTGGTATMTGTWPAHTVFKLESVNLMLGRFPVQLDDCEVIGSGILMIPSGSTCKSLRMTSGDSRGPTINIKRGSKLIDAAGEPMSLQIDSDVVVAGEREAGLHPHVLVSTGGGTPSARTELDSISLFDLTWESLPHVEGAALLLPWLPHRRFMSGIDRRSANRMAYGMELGASDPRLARSRRAHFWSTVADAMKRQATGGSAYAATREIAYQTRRQASAWNSPSRWLLEVARSFGFGTRIGRPIAVWFLVAVVASLLLLVAADAPFEWEGDWLLLDVLTSPTSFLRGQNWNDALTPIVDRAGGPGRLIMAVTRGIGLASIVFSAVAISMYTRLPGIGKPDH